MTIPDPLSPANRLIALMLCGVLATYHLKMLHGIAGKVGQRHVAVILRALIIIEATILVAGEAWAVHQIVYLLD